MRIKSEPMRANSSMSPASPKELLLSPDLPPERVEAILRPYGFQSIRRADANLQLVADELQTRQILSEVLEPLLVEVAQSPDPDQALNGFERLTRASLQKAGLLTYLKASPYTLSLLVKILGSSAFMAEILIRNPTYVYWISREDLLKSGLSKAALRSELRVALRQLRSSERRLDLMRVFKRKILLLIGSRDLLRLATVSETTRALSDLADLLIETAVEVCRTQLEANLKLPKTGSRSRRDFAVIGMGKLGGAELNFSSDVDLLYFYASPATKTTSRHAGSTADFYERLAREVTSAISAVTKEGYLFRVDLRLRPDGDSGAIVPSLAEARKYYATRGQNWERLALLKARAIGGNRSVGERFLKSVERFVYAADSSARLLHDVRAIKEKIQRVMEKRGQASLNVKLGSGGIREIEFIVQSLQVLFGGRLRGIRDRNTLSALTKLARHALLTKEEAANLRDAYLFLRDAEHKLQMVMAIQTHSLPTDRTELRRCANRMGYHNQPGLTAEEAFDQDFRRHTSLVHAAFTDLFTSPEQSRILNRARRIVGR